MDSEILEPNELRILQLLLRQLEKRIYLLRVSLYGNTDKYCPGAVSVSKKLLEFTESEDSDNVYNLSADDYRLMVDSCDLETALHRILNELTNANSYKALKEVIVEFENESTAFKKHQKMIDAKRKQIDQLKQVLPVIQEQAQVTAERLKSKKFEAKRETEHKVEHFDELAFLKTLMDYKVESKKNYYRHMQTKLENSIEWYERETRTQKHADVQTISYWLLKYDKYSEKLDMQLRHMFDNWASKRRDLNVLKKYRRLNQEKIQKLHKLISERENYIEKDRKEKEIEQKKREAKLRRQNAAIKIQSFWRGTMVRKQLGPYKIKKPKKEKGKKGKGKKK